MFLATQIRKATPMTHCTHPGGCPRPHHARGWCSRHYDRILRHGAPGPAKINQRQPVNSVATTPRALAVTEDLTDLQGTDSPDAIAHRLGYKSARTLARVLYRWGYRDLARPLWDAKQHAAEVVP